MPVPASPKPTNQNTVNPAHFLPFSRKYGNTWTSLDLYVHAFGDKIFGHTSLYRDLLASPFNVLRCAMSFWYLASSRRCSCRQMCEKKHARHTQQQRSWVVEGGGCLQRNSARHDCCGIDYICCPLFQHLTRQSMLLRIFSSSKKAGRACTRGSVRLPPGRWCAPSHLNDARDLIADKLAQLVPVLQHVRHDASKKP